MTDPFLPANHVQGSQEWLDMRKNYIGASEAASIMGENPWTTPLQAWEQKVGVVAPPTENEAMRRGTRLEPFARNAFANEFGLDVYPKIVYHPHIKFMMASMDGLTLDGKEAVEFKCPGAKAHAMALKQIVPPYYVAQLQHQLACLELDYIYYYSFDGENGVGFKVGRNEEYITRLIDTEKEWWYCVENFVSPEPMDADYEKKDWHLYEERVAEIDRTMALLKKEREDIKKSLVIQARGRSCKSGGLSLRRTFPRGTVDYKAIPELLEMDLDPYRREPKETWTLRVK